MSAFLKKEILSHIRNGQFVILVIVFMLFGILNPATAKLTPKLLELAKDSLASSGLEIHAMKITALDAWLQFFKNWFLVLIIFLLVEGEIFCKEYAVGTLLISVTKGLSRYKIVLAKFVVLVTAWTLGLLLSFGLTYIYSDYYWDNATVLHIFSAALGVWLLGLLVITFFVFFSVVVKTSTSALLGTGLSFGLIYLLSLWPKFKKFSPLLLGQGSQLITKQLATDDLITPVIVTLIMGLVLLVLAIPVFNRRRL